VRFTQNLRIFAKFLGSIYQWWWLIGGVGFAMVYCISVNDFTSGRFVEKFVDVK